MCIEDSNVTNQTTEIDEHQWFSKAHQNSGFVNDFFNPTTSTKSKGSLKSMPIVIVHYIQAYIY